MDKALKSDMNLVADALADYFDDLDWPALTPSGLLVWSALLSCSSGAALASVSMSRLQSDCRLGSRNTVSRALSELEDKGYIERVDFLRSANLARTYLFCRLGRNWREVLDTTRSALELTREEGLAKCGGNH